MAEKNNAKCSICDKGYYLCVSCRDSLQLNPYKRWTCSPVHYQVHQVVRGFFNGVYTKDEARDKLRNTNLSDIDTFKPNIKQIIKDILKEDEPVVEPVIEVQETVREAPVVEEFEPVAEIDVKAISRNKRSYKFGSAE